MRHFDDWLSAYEEFVADTESPKQFHKWVGVSPIAATLRKKVYFRLGRIVVSPNMYVVLVGPPGVRKSQAIDFGYDLLSSLEIVTAADTITLEALYIALEAAKIETEMPNGDIHPHCSMSIVARELEVFLGQKQHNAKMLAFLTAAFDASFSPFTYTTKGAGSNEIASIFVNVIAATTPDSLANSFPPGAIGGGLTSRILFIHGIKKAACVPIPETSERVEKMRTLLIEDLMEIAMMAGEVSFDKDSRQYWIDWYNKYEMNIQDHPDTRICTDPSFDGWYERKPIYILKVAQVIVASATASYTLTVPLLKRAIKYIESVENTMGDAFSVVGRSEVAFELDLMSRTIRKAKHIKQTDLHTRVCRQVDSHKFKNVMETLVYSGKVKIETRENIPTYVWIGE